MRYCAVLLLVLGASTAGLAQELPPLEAYGELPAVNYLVISPSGRLIAYRRITDDIDVVAVVDIESAKLVTSVDVHKVKPRALRFVDDDSLVLFASDALRWSRYGGALEIAGSWMLDIDTGNLRQLLINARERSPYATANQVVGATADGDRIFVPAFAGDRRWKYSLFEIERDTWVERLVQRGEEETMDWFVDEEGRPMIREDFDGESNAHRIWSTQDSTDVLLYEHQGEGRLISPKGLTGKRDELIYTKHSLELDAWAAFRMSVTDGETQGQLFGREHRSVSRVLTDINRVVIGVEYEGFQPSYDFLDAELTERVNAIQSKLPGASARLVSWSSDFDRLVFHASGGWTSGAYLMFTKGKDDPQMLAAQREQISAEHIATSYTTEYEARDGLIIPALLTAYPDVLEAGKATLIVLPHGGPASFDRANFDWMAQYFASRGHIVLQPQFRGSEGFGVAFRTAGNGEWGRLMQSDLDDGVQTLIDAGVVDSDRVCIVGSSYGGYAALAAGAFSPELYRCHISINGVSDLREMLRDDHRELGGDHSIVQYWEKWFGAEYEDRQELDALSPAKNAAGFQGPVLLIHCLDDTVVPVTQSKIMRTALRRADKDVKFVRIRGEDHWLSSEETRLEVLQAVAEFIEQHL